MSIDYFTKSDFEGALPVNKKTGEVMWQEPFCLNGTWHYQIPVHNKKGLLTGYIRVGSTVDCRTGIRREIEKDSIRLWIVDKWGKVAGNKVDDYTNRLPGWAKRMNQKIAKLYSRMTFIRPCKCCGHNMKVFQVNKEGKNKGRVFLNCKNPNCTKPEFVWVIELDKKE